jgi:SAM-dependent methyltransferase
MIGWLPPALAMIGTVSAPSLVSLAYAVLRVPAPERALVIGCAEGEAVLLLAREFPAARVRGLDPSPALVRAATARVGLDPEGRVAFKVGRASALPYPDGFFDLAVQLAGRAAPGELARVLRPGAHLILAASPRRGPARRCRERLLRRRLAARGFVAARADRARDGNFLVARLDLPDRSARSI